MRETSPRETTGAGFDEIRLPEPVEYQSSEPEIEPPAVDPPNPPMSLPGGASMSFQPGLPETQTGNRMTARSQSQGYGSQSYARPPAAAPMAVPMMRPNPVPSSSGVTVLAGEDAAPVGTSDPVSEQAVTEAASESEPFANDASYQTVNVFYATDRKEAELSLADFYLTGQRRWISALGMGGGVAALLFFVACLLRRRAAAILTGGLMAAMSIAALTTFVSGNAGIEKTGVAYSAERGELVRGICEVTIPKNHSRGELERPSLLKFEVNEDQSKHIVLTSVEPLPSDQFHQELQSELSASQQPDLLVFIHGYNVDFESAVHRTAQIAVDLPFQGVPVCYSWPSQGTLLGYPIDENNVTWTVGHLKQFLGELVLQSGAKSIHVVAHSMGNRAMTTAMQQLALTRQQDGALFDRVVLAAPDVDADLFRKDLAPALTQVAKHVTLYASSSDQALIASKQVHGYPRAGETGEHLVVVNGVDTIDVSGIDLSLLGHSYYGESEPMLRDLFKVLLSRLPASQRDTLISRDFQSKIYWQLANQPRIARGVSR